MLYAVPTLIACGIAVGFCYTVSGFFPTLRARPSRCACVAMPIVIAGLLLLLPEWALAPFGDMIANAPLIGSMPFLFNGGAAVAACIAVFLTTFTLLIAALIGQISLMRQQSP